MTSNSLLDALKKRLNLPSDYALARTVFHIDPGSLKEMRQRGLSDERALQVAELLDLNPGEVLAAVHAERAKDKNVKAAWERAAKALRAAAVGSAFFVVGVMGSIAPNTAQGGTSSMRDGVYYVKRRRRLAVARSLNLTPLLSFFGISLAT